MALPSKAYAGHSRTGQWAATNTPNASNPARGFILERDPASEAVSVTATITLIDSTTVAFALLLGHQYYIENLGVAASVNVLYIW
jgi:hypothetical protein